MSRPRGPDRRGDPNVHRRAVSASLEHMRAVARMGRVPADVYEAGRPMGTLGEKALRGHFGSWSAAVGAALGSYPPEGGLPVRGRPVVPGQMVVEAIRTEARRRGLSVWALAHAIASDHNEGESTFRRWRRWQKGQITPSLERARADLEALGITRAKEAA